MRKDNRKKKNAVRMLTVGLVMGMTTPAFAAGWQAGAGANAGKWWYSTNDANTAWHANGWQWLDGNHDGVSECYYFGSDGYMYADTKTPDSYTVNKDGAWTVNGVVQTKVSEDYGKNGSWKQGAGANSGKYWFDNGDGSYRKSGWHWLDGNKDGVAECYYFDNDGWLVARKTVENYTVDADGAWTINGVKQTKNSGLSNGKSSVAYSTSSGGSSRSSGGSGGSSSGGSHSSGGGSSSGGNSGSTSVTIEDELFSNYSDKVTTGGTEYENGPSHGGYWSGDWTNEMESATNEVVWAFKSTYITSGMSDFEKEIQIIRYIVENCSYNKDTDNSWSAYGALVEGEAKCMGYADAFMVLGKACGLDVRYIVSSTHAWNLIKLDGKWYHVDVTWEDPDMPGGNNGYGFDKLRNKYINLTDDEMKTFYDHKSWTPNKIKANGTAYGHLTVRRYLEDGVIDTNSKSYYNINYEDTINSYEANGYRIVSYTNVNDTANQIIEYISNRIDNKEKFYRVLIKWDKNYTYKSARAIKEAVNTAIVNKYQDTLSATFVFLLDSKSDDYVNYYSYAAYSLSYKNEKNNESSKNESTKVDEQVTCNISFKNESGEIVGTWSGTGTIGEDIKITCPDGYILLRDENGGANAIVYECTEGNVKGLNKNGNKCVTLGTTSSTLIVSVEHSAIFYTLNYVDESGDIVASDTGMTKIRNGINLNIPDDYELVIGDDRYPTFSVLEGDANKVIVHKDQIKITTNGDYVVNVFVKANSKSASSSDAT